MSLNMLLHHISGQTKAKPLAGLCQLNSAWPRNASARRHCQAALVAAAHV